MWANKAYIGQPDLHHTKLGLTDTNLQQQGTRYITKFLKADI